MSDTMDTKQIGRLQTLMTTELNSRYDAGTVSRSSYSEQTQAITEHTDRLRAVHRSTPAGDPRQLGLPVTQEQRDAARSRATAQPVSAAQTAQRQVQTQQPQGLTL